MTKSIIKFFDRLEDKVHSRLSRYPLAYALIGGVAIVLFWRGVWHTADEFPFMTGPVSLAISIVALLLTGLFVSFFVGDNIILTGIKKEKKLAEKTESEIKTERDDISGLKEEIKGLRNDLEEIKKDLINK